MRESERIREKVVFHLDGRQIAGLVVGCLVAFGIVFGAGYWVGRELTPPAPTAAAPVIAAVEKPVAAKAGENGASKEDGAATARTVTLPPKYTFDRTLKKETPPVQIDDPTLRIAQRERDRLAAEERAAADRAMTAFEEKRFGATSEVKDRLPPADNTLTGTPRAAGPTAPAAPRDLPAAIAEHGPDTGAVEPADDDEAAAPTDVADEPAGATANEKSGKGWTIQIKAFRARGEAREFMQILTANGHKPYLTTADVEGKGRFYRVRLGQFKTMDAAEKKRKAFERAEGFQTIVTPF
ncbi:MAG: SPOR domain-containing protein [Myxococcales bacterium]|nr:SPOR domain-containing protein [Myxococcales bacterium]